MEFNKNKVHRVSLNKEYSLFGKTVFLKINNKDKFTSDINIETLSKIRQLSNLDKIKNILEYYQGISVLNISGSNNYNLIIGNKKSKEYANYLNVKILETLPMVTDYHFNIFPIRKKCYEGLIPVMLDGNVLATPIYNHSGVTGRTGIKKGYNFLTMKKQDRSRLQSCNKNYDLIEVDFKSCEPFFYLKSKGFEIKESDVYEWLTKKYNLKNIDRSKIKRGILSIIYGANSYVVSKVMQIDKQIINEIKNDLGIVNLENTLQEEYNKNGYILNYYQRPITSDSNLVNYWIQSSAVDFCSLAFKSFYEDYNLKPCFFVHDSMTFAIEKKRTKDIMKIQSIKENISGINIPVNFTVYS
jgi:hypothetical protein